MAVYKAYAFFTASKVGKASITVTVDVYKAADDSQVATGQAANEVAGGLYSYSYTSASNDDYLFIFKTTDTSVDLQNIPALATEQLSANLDAQVSTLPALVWAVATSALTAAGTIGKLLLDLQIAIAALPDVPDIMNGLVEDTITLAEAHRLELAVLCGQLSGSGTGTLSFYSMDNLVARVIAHMDTQCNRTSITKDVTD